ncbi:hypothetical protein [Anaerolentibacter hominis]|uniref:hypothetical protein n=1 Tax=Anaerolentibacter hominis TaxID=3079009 RepID=UPI0031B7EB3F
MFSDKKKIVFWLCLAAVTLAGAFALKEYIVHKNSMPYCSEWYNEKTELFECPVAENEDLWQSMSIQECIESQQIPVDILPCLGERRHTQYQ